MKLKLLSFALLFFASFVSFGSAILINEVELNPEGGEVGNEWVELYSEDEFNLDGYYLENNDGDVFILNGTFTGYYIIQSSDFRLDNSDERVYLKYNKVRTINGSDVIVDETPILEDNENDVKAWSKCIGINPEWRFVLSSKGDNNHCPGGGSGGGGGGGGGQIPVLNIALREQGKIYNLEGLIRLRFRTQDWPYALQLNNIEENSAGFLFMISEESDNAENYKVKEEFSLPVGESMEVELDNGIRMYVELLSVNNGRDKAKVFVKKIVEENEELGFNKLVLDSIVELRRIVHEKIVL